MSETHVHLPGTVGYVIAIIVGIFMLIFDWYGGISAVGWGWAIFIGLIGLGLIIVGFLKLLSG